MPHSVRRSTGCRVRRCFLVDYTIWTVSGRKSTRTSHFALLEALIAMVSPLLNNRRKQRSTFANAPSNCKSNFTSFVPLGSSGHLARNYCKRSSRS